MSGFGQKSDEPEDEASALWSDSPTELHDGSFELEGDGGESEPPTIMVPNPMPGMPESPLYGAGPSYPTQAVAKRTDLSEIPIADSDLLESEATDGHASILDDGGQEDVPTMDLPLDIEERQKSDAPPPFEPKAIGMFGRYQLLGRLAMGGMAEIFLARESADGATSRYIVIKRIRSTVADDNEFVSMFLNEARLAMHLRHPNICHLYEFGFETGHHFLAMEYVDGATLHKAVRKAAPHGGVPIPIAIKIISQVAGALSYAHSARDNRRKPLNIVHRDVSPHNVMIGYDGIVKLLDFGVAKASTQDVLTMAGVVRGKFAYMSPQQCVGERLDGRSDIFSLGVVLYELLTGQRLYRRENQFETMRAVVDDPVPSIRAINPHLPEELDRIVKKALAKDPNDRFPTADVMQEELDHFLAARREVVSTARVIAYMEDLFKEEIGRGPEIDQDVEFETSLPSVSMAPLVPASAEAAVAHAAKTTQRDTKRREAVAHPTVKMTKRPSRANSDWLWLGIAVVAIVLTVAVVASALRGNNNNGVADPGPTPAPVAQGTLVVQAPPDATVIINHKTIGQGNKVLSDLPVGQVEVEVTRPGYKPWTRTVIVKASDPTMIEAKLVPHVATGKLTIDGPAGAVARLDGKFICKVPCVYEAPTGKQSVTVSQPGYSSYEEDVEIKEGSSVTVTAELSKNAPVAMGTLTVNTVPWSNVVANGKKLGSTPIPPTKIKAGTVKLVLTDGQGRVLKKTVVVPPNGSKSAVFNFNEK